MTDGMKKLEAALKETLATKADSPECVAAALGAYVAGLPTVRVADEPDMVWCRIGSNESDRVKAFNQSATGVGEHFDLPVIICRDPLFPSMWRVAGRDLARYETWGDNYGPALPMHGLDHSFGAGSNMGGDPVWVFKRQMMPLLPRPTITGSTSIYIGPEYYYFDGEYRYFGGTGTIDLMASYGPTGTFTARFVTCYLDGNDSIAYLPGDEFNAAFPPTPANSGPFIPVPLANQGVPIAAVYLSTGTSRIPWRSIYDLRFVPTVVPSTGSFLSVYDEGVFIGSSSEIDFVGVGVSATFAAQRATVTLASPVTGSFVAVDEGAVLGSATELNFIGSAVSAALVGNRMNVTVVASSPGSTRFAVGQPASLGNGATGTYWIVPDSEYYTGSLALALGGVVQSPGIDYDEQHPGSGTYEFLTERPPTGSVQTVWYGVEA